MRIKNFINGVIVLTMFIYLTLCFMAGLADYVAILNNLPKQVDIMNEYIVQTKIGPVRFDMVITANTTLQAEKEVKRLFFGCKVLKIYKREG